jgi:hypothetical protein
VGGTITACAGSTATFTPSADLAINTTYTATLTTGVQEPGGTPLAIPYVWTFKTGATPSTTPPTVTAVTPLNGATGVALNTAITAMFDEAMDPATMNGSTFKLASGCAPAATTPVAGAAVTYNPINNIITLTPGGNLAPLTCFTATVTIGAESLADVAMVAPFVWTFTTGAAADLTPPTVISTSPVNGATDVPLNQLITATFSKAMNDNTINTTTFTLYQGATPIPGTVSYIAGSDTAIFTPTSNLTADTVYTATITTGVSDLAGNFLVTADVWSFTTAAAPLIVSPTVVSTNPANNATGVCLNAAINATFSTVMDPATINTATFYVTAGGVPVAGTISFTNGATGTIATFTPLHLLTVSTTYIVTITTGVTDLAGNPLLVDDVWSFTTVAEACLAPVALGAATPFGALAGGAGMTNMGILTSINGDIGTTGASQTMTGFHDLTEPYVQFSAGCLYTETTLNVGTVNGGIFTAPGTTQPSATCPHEGTTATNAVATEAAADALTAYNALLPIHLPAGAACPGSGNGGGLILAPGVYTCATTFLITGGDLTLDAGNNANAVWVFQVGTALTVGDTLPRNVILINGASAANVFWQVGSGAVINYAGGGTMSGTIIASAGVTLSSPANSTNPTLTVLNGRALGLGAAVTMVNTVINVPGQ